MGADVSWNLGEVPPVGGGAGIVVGTTGGIVVGGTVVVLVPGRRGGGGVDGRHAAATAIEPMTTARTARRDRVRCVELGRFIDSLSAGGAPDL